MELQISSQAEGKGETALGVMDAPVEPGMSLQDWADAINRDTEAEHEAILRKGRRLLAAKKALGHGQWERLFKKHRHDTDAPVPFTVATARMYMTIAQYPPFSNRNLGYVLPTCWTALYQLALIPEPIFYQLIQDGDITPGLGKAEAKALRHFASPFYPRMEKPKKRGTHPLRRYADDLDSLETARALLCRYWTLVSEGLSGPLRVSDNGQIESGCIWIPPFTQPSPMKAKPIRTRHRCECGHEHEDQR